MIPLQEDLLINPKRLYNKIIELIDKYRKNIETKDIFYYKYIVEELRNTSFWNLYIMSNNSCMHEYKNGKKEGQICGAKIFIKTDNKLQKYLCSRHCRDYETNIRKYSSNNIRCTYIRNNNKQCRHRCVKNKDLCYIHIDKTKAEEELQKELYINRLKMKRFLFFKKIKNKRYKKQILYLQNFNETEIKRNKKIFFKNFKNYKKYIKYINYNSLYNLTEIT